MLAPAPHVITIVKEYDASELYGMFVETVRPLLKEIMTAYDYFVLYKMNTAHSHATHFTDYESKSLLFIDYCTVFLAYLHTRVEEKDAILQEANEHMLQTIQKPLSPSSSKQEADDLKKRRLHDLCQYMEVHLGLFGSNNILSDLIDEVPYIHWLSRTLAYFIIHIQDMLSAVKVRQTFNNAQGVIDNGDALERDMPHNPPTTMPKRYDVREMDISIRDAVIKCGDTCLAMSLKLEKLVLARGMLVFLTVLVTDNHPDAFLQENYLILLKNSIDRISKIMLTRARSNFGEQRNVYGSRDPVRLRRVEAYSTHARCHDMLQNNYPCITLRIVETSHQKFEQLLKGIVQNLSTGTMSITFDVFFMVFLCSRDQPIETYDTLLADDHIAPVSYTNHKFTTNHRNSFAFKIVECMKANKVLHKIRTKSWSPIDTELPKHAGLVA